MLESSVAAGLAQTYNIFRHFALSQNINCPDAKGQPTITRITMYCTCTWSYPQQYVPWCRVLVSLNWIGSVREGFSAWLWYPDSWDLWSLYSSSEGLRGEGLQRRRFLSCPERSQRLETWQVCNSKWGPIANSMEIIELCFFKKKTLGF